MTDSGVAPQQESTGREPCSLSTATASLSLENNGDAQEFFEAEDGLDEEEEEEEGPAGGALQDPGASGKAKGASTTGGYRFDTPEHKEQLRAQREQLWAWLKGVGRNMMREGVNLTKISLPVCLFEPRSFLQRMVTNWDYMDLLLRAAASADPVERLRYVVAFAVSGLCRQVSFHKPFNPILGETLQAVYPGSGVRVFAEQISHHPPVSAWQVLEPAGQFAFFGTGNWSAGIKGNSVRGRQTGKNAVTFKSDGATVEYDLPGLVVKGVLWGERVIKYAGEMTFTDAQNGLTCVVQIDPVPKQSYISSWFRSKTAAGYVPDQVVGSLTRKGVVVDTLSGTWLTHLEWQKGAGRVWDIRSSAVTPVQPCGDAASGPALLSDSRHREDLVALATGDQAVAQEWKGKLEVAQRHDRGLRKEGGGFVEH